MTALSGVVVAQLGTAEQLLLWALRQRSQDGTTSPLLVQGFHLACGLAGVEGALGHFERLFATLACAERCTLCPLRCAVVGRDEARCIALLASAQAGEIRRAERLAASIVGAERASALREAAFDLATALRRAGHELVVRGPAPATLH